MCSSRAPGKGSVSVGKPVCAVGAEPDGRWWSLQCVQVPAVISQVADLYQAALTVQGLSMPGLIEKGAGGSHQ